MDIEYSEKWNVPKWLDKGLLDNVQQLVIEYHWITDDSAPVYANIFKRIMDLGFNYAGTGDLKIKTLDKITIFLFQALIRTGWPE